MTRNEANVFLAVILGTVGETSGGVPSGHLYAALMGRMGLDDYENLIGLAKQAGLVVEARSHLLTLTPKGRDMVATIEKFKQANAATG
jgi:hypothetical protein